MQTRKQRDGKNAYVQKKTDMCVCGLWQVCEGGEAERDETGDGEVYIKFVWTVWSKLEVQQSESRAGCKRRRKLKKTLSIFLTNFLHFSLSCSRSDTSVKISNDIMLTNESRREVVEISKKQMARIRNNGDNKKRKLGKILGENGIKEKFGATRNRK